MIIAEKFLRFLKKEKIEFITGVPDSILKNLTLPLEKLSKINHMVSTNEGSAIASAVGYYLAKKKMASVYLQNSGLGNALNPLISIAHQKVYSIPMLLIIGWRGGPNHKDEPQHEAKGKITLQLLKLLNIKTCVIQKTKDLKKLSKLISYGKKFKVPVSCLFEKNILQSNKKNKIKNNKNELTRSDIIEKLLEQIKKKTKIVSTTGYTSRELHQIRNYKKKKFNSEDFYMVGGMGHSISVALSISINSKKEVLCLDGDGSILMHLGALGVAGNFGNKNLKHVIFNNFSHESVGRQDTIANKINFLKLTKSLGYKRYFQVSQKKHLKKNLKKFLDSSGPSLLEAKIQNFSLKNLSRPRNLIGIKKNFMKNF
jgi:phosphonopyruvate decarboxylase